MTPEERAHVVASLPSDVPFELSMPEGDPHRLAKERTLGALGAFFAKIGRKVYLSSALAVYYPGEPRFAPDVLAVVDVDPHPRMNWVVAHEGHGLDVVLEVDVSGEWQKDFEANRKRYARLGIPEYFLRLGCAIASSAGGFQTPRRASTRRWCHSSASSHPACSDWTFDSRRIACVSTAERHRFPKRTSSWRRSARWSTIWSSGGSRSARSAIRRFVASRSSRPSSRSCEDRVNAPLPPPLCGGGPGWAPLEAPRTLEAPRSRPYPLILAATTFAHGPFPRRLPHRSSQYAVFPTSAGSNSCT